MVAQLNRQKIDVGVLAYSFDEDPFGTSTILYEYQITNRNVETIENLNVGLWLDNDHGCSEDDYIGCIPGEQLVFSYNQDAIDGIPPNGACGGVNSFTNGIPLFGVKVLQGIKNDNGEDYGLQSFIYMNRQGLGNPNSATTDPTKAREVYNYLNGLWRDGTPITIGGDGYDLSSTDFTKFSFPDAPNDPNGWSLCNPEGGFQDRRGLLGLGATKLLPGESSKFSFAAILTEKVEHPCPDITPLINAAQDAQTTYDLLPSSAPIILSHTSFTFQPNPAQDYVNIFTGGGGQIQKIQLFNINGQLLQTYDQVNTMNYHIEFDGFADGVYLVKVEMEDGGFGVQRLVIH